MFCFCNFVDVCIVYTSLCWLTICVCVYSWKVAKMTTQSFLFSFHFLFTLIPSDAFHYFLTFYWYCVARRVHLMQFSACVLYLKALHKVQQHTWLRWPDINILVSWFSFSEKLVGLNCKYYPILSFLKKICHLKYVCTFSFV